MWLGGTVARAVGFWLEIAGSIPSCLGAGRWTGKPYDITHWPHGPAALAGAWLWLTAINSETSATPWATWLAKNFPFTMTLTQPATLESKKTEPRICYSTNHKETPVQPLASFNVTDLRSLWSPTVNTHVPHTRRLTKLVGNLSDLLSQLPCWNDNQTLRNNTKQIHWTVFLHSIFPILYRIPTFHIYIYITSKLAHSVRVW